MLDQQNREHVQSTVRLSYDKTVDALYIYLSSEEDTNAGGIVEATDSFEIENLLEFGLVNMDFDKDKRLVGLEILQASKILSENFLSNLC